MMTVTKEADMGKKADKGPRPATAAGAAEAADLPERWSAQRKTELVMQLLRGEGLDAVSRDSQVPGMSSRAKIGELMMRLELAEYLIEKRGLADTWKKSRR